MAQPDVKAQVVRGPLRDVSIAYKNETYIADRVFSIIDNCPPTAKIYKYAKGAWFRDEAGIRAPGSRAKRGGYPTSTVNIDPKEYAFAKEVTDEDRKYADLAFAPPLKPDQDAIEFCSDKIDISKERRVSSLILAQTWADGNSGGEDAAGLWAAGAGNTFLVDIRNGQSVIKSKCGLKPNVLALDFKTYLSLCEESTLLAKIQYTQKAVMTAEILASLLDLQEVLVGDAVYSSAKENKAGTDFTAAQIWEKNSGKGMGFLFYRPPAPGLKIPSAGYQARVPYEQNASRRLTNWRENAEHQDVYEVAENVDIVATGLDCGYLWIDTVAT